MSDEEIVSPYTFISYTHDRDEAHRERVLRLADRLVNEGINCHIDRYNETPPPVEGWPRWMGKQVENSDFVLVVCTPNYYHCFRGDDECLGKGAVWEGAMITQSLYDDFAKNTKFIPIGFASYKDADSSIVGPLRATNYYDVSSEDGYNRLYRHLTNQPEITRPTLGMRRTLTARDGSSDAPNP